MNQIVNFRPDEAPKARRIPEGVITGLAAITGAVLAVFVGLYLFYG